VLSDHQKSRALSVLVENQEMNTYPKAAGGVSMLEPSIIHAKYQPRQNEKPPAIPSFVGFSTPKSPTRFYEDPKIYITE